MDGWINGSVGVGRVGGWVEGVGGFNNFKAQLLDTLEARGLRKQ